MELEPNRRLPQAPSYPATAAAMDAFAMTALRAALALGSLFAVLIVAGALATGVAPIRAALGVSLVALWVGAAWRHRLAARVLRRRHAPTVVAVALAALLAADGAWENPYTAITFWVVGVSVVVESPTGVAMCAAASIAGYIAGLVIDGVSPAEIVDSEHGPQVMSNAACFILVGLIALTVVEALRRVVMSAPHTLAAVRAGHPAFTEPLAAAIRAAAPPAGLLPPARAVDLVARLTHAERRVASQLARGESPKEIALRTGVGLATVRAQIRSAKRKVGARTLEQLVGFVAVAEDDDD
jgi:DNA-binding CsgD family transcriptional regulator